MRHLFTRIFLVTILGFLIPSISFAQECMANCKGYSGPGGPCYSGPGGPAYPGPGGGAYSGPGGP